jgi:hypothetical protein
VIVASCITCSEVSLCAAQSLVCGDCAPSISIRGFTCTSPDCQEPIHRDFSLDIVLEGGNHTFQEAEIVGLVVHKIIRSITKIKGPQCESHLSAQLDSICCRREGRSSGFDLLYKATGKEFAKKKTQQFREEWA